jgi:class 3 adenylate cyclase
MNAIVAPGCAPAEPAVAPPNAFQRVEDLSIRARCVAFAEDLFRPDYRSSAETHAGSADCWPERRPMEFLRRRMAILVADIAGYSRLIEMDDVGTVVRLRCLWGELVAPAAAFFHAALIRHWADSVLLAFADTVDAIGCALTLQSVLFLLNEGLPEDQRIRLRIGLSVGEILLVDEEVHGISVNIAARLQSLAGAGEVYLCEHAVNDVRHLLALVFEPIGACRLHNISTPVRTFRVAIEVIAGIARQRRLPAVDDLPAC